MDAPADLIDFCSVEYPRLVGALSLYCGDADVAEDLAQEALIRACQRWNAVREMSAPGAWLYRVGLNLAHSHFRRRTLAARVMRRVEHPRNEGIDLADVVAVRQAVASLPHRQRAVLAFRYFLDLSVIDTAAALGTSPSAVRSLSHRALIELRSILDIDDALLLEEVNDAF